jgi:hypothetical protein
MLQPLSSRICLLRSVFSAFRLWLFGSCLLGSGFAALAFRRCLLSLASWLGPVVSALFLKDVGEAKEVEVLRSSS